LDAALDIFDGLAMATVERKAAALGDLFLSRCETIGLETVSPGVGERRGGHVSLRHANGFEIVQALIANGVIGDFRAPDLMRFGFSPLYTGYADVWRAADRLLRIVAEESWRDARFARRRTVT
ncbi:MAG: kynureninase/PvdN C-terminal domain-containing protein, partial [Hyphococcus sp.]